MKLFDKEFAHNVRGTRQIIRFNSKAMNRLLKRGYYIETVSELYFDDEEVGLTFNNWVDEYSEGAWGLSQKDIDNSAKEFVRKFSHLSRRRNQKVIPRAFKETYPGEDTIMIYLYMRDKIQCDYAIFFRRRD